MAIEAKGVGLFPVWGSRHLAHRSRLVALEVNDLGFAEDGSGTVLIGRTKTDVEGQGSLRYLAPHTVAILKRWQFKTGALSHCSPH